VKRPLARPLPIDVVYAASAVLRVENSELICRITPLGPSEGMSRWPGVVGAMAPERVTQVGVSARLGMSHKRMRYEREEAARLRARERPDWEVVDSFHFTCSRELRIHLIGVSRRSFAHARNEMAGIEQPGAANADAFVRAKG
jgi:hypothetical protein